MRLPDMTVIGITIGTNIMHTSITAVSLFLSMVSGGASTHGITTPTTATVTATTLMTIAGILTTEPTTPLSETYGYYNGYAPSGQYSNTVVNAVQSKLASLGYYHGAIDGVLGDESQAALARYQQDQDLSVTGTVTSATLQALDLSYSGL
jgi:peptidoglycan hydrolase-like protein with peptidoglycan-binding domain